MVSLIQPSFARGVISPALYGRVDTAAYQVALRKGLNGIIAPYGGFYNRPGLRFIAPFKYHDREARLIPFQFKTTDSYVLEFGDFYMRVLRNDGHVSDATFLISAITKANPAVMTVDAGLLDGEEVAINGVLGMTQVNGRRFTVSMLTATTFTLIDQLTGVNVDSTAYGAYVSDGSAQRIYEIVTPYSSEDLAGLKFVQSADVMTLTHRSFPIYQLSRLDHDDWTLEEAVFGPGHAYPTGQTVTPTGAASTTHSYRVTAHKNGTLEESLPGVNSTTGTITAATAADPAVFTDSSHGLSDGDEIQLDGTADGEWATLLTRRLVVDSSTTNTYQLLDEAGELIDSSGFGSYGASVITTRQTFVRITNSNATPNNLVAWDAVADTEKYSVYKFQGGIYGFIGETTALSFRDNNISPDLSRSHPQANDPFLDADEKPNCSNFYEQRQVFGGALGKPDTSQYSQIGLFRNMNISSPLQEDDAFAATINSGQVNEIRHYVALKDLLVFTSGSEWRVNSGQDSAFSANSIKQNVQSNWGCSDVPPLVAGATVLFVIESGAQVRSLGFKFEIDGYDGNNLAIFAPHYLLGRSIREWVYGFSPDPRVYMVMSDGKALTLTFDQEQQVIAWTDWETAGKFETVTAIRNPLGSAELETGIYFGIKRKRGAFTQRYIEKLASRQFTDVRDCFFLDSGLTYDQPIAITNVSIGTTTTITAPAHGLTNGLDIELSDIEWEVERDATGEPLLNDNGDPLNAAQLNYGRYLVASATADTFRITDEDGNDIDSSEFSAYVEGGNVRSLVNSISGFDHLAGMAVTALFDGNSHQEDLTISETGVLTIPEGHAPAARVHVGLPYITDMETLNIEQPGANLQPRKKLLTKVIARFEQTRGLLFGSKSSDLVEMKQRMNETFNEPTRMLTGDFELTLPAEWNSQGRMFFRQIYPLPMGIQALMPDLEAGD
jgi:hypothetical protein